MLYSIVLCLVFNKQNDDVKEEKSNELLCP